MKFATFALVSAFFASTSFSSVVATDESFRPVFVGDEEAVLSEMAAVSENPKHYSWAYSADLKGATGSVEDPGCISAFTDAFVTAWNGAHEGGDVHSEGCTVESVTPEFSAGLRSGGGGYNYNGGSDWR